MKKVYLITVIALFTTVTAWHLLLMLPQTREKNRMTVSLVDSENKIHDLKKIITEIPRNFTAENQMLMRKRNLMSKLYSRDDIINLLDEISRKSSLNNVELVEISPSIEMLLALNKIGADQNNLQTLDITMRLQGTLKNIGQYIRGIENHSFYRGVNSCRISNPIEGKQASDVYYSFKALLGTLKES